MAALNVRIDPSDFAASLEDIERALEDKELFLRPICTELLGIMHERIHLKGLASDGAKIGQYKTSYLAIREREQHHSKTETDVILVFTRFLSNSWIVFATDRGYCVGFKDDTAPSGVTSLKKIKYAEERFGKKIEDLTKEEQEYVNERFNEIVQDLINDNNGGR